MKTITKTKSVTSAKMAVATLALVASLGLNFALVPIKAKGGGTIMTEIKVPTYSCTDTDDANINVRGTVVSNQSGKREIINSITQTDECQDGVILKEYICDGSTPSKINFKLIKCRDRCLNGACVTTKLDCTDTDGGKVYGKQGTVTTKLMLTDGSKSEIQKVITDKCEGNILYENYCNQTADVGYVTSQMDCKKELGLICKSGACVKDLPSVPLPIRRTTP